MKHLIQDDIIGSIETNHKVGNITTEDAYKLRRYTQQLWEYIQTHTEELKGVEDMTDESFMTDIDILCEEYNKKVEQGRREGRQEGIRIVAIKMLQSGDSVEKVSNITDLPVEKVLEMQKELSQM